MAASIHEKLSWVPEEHIRVNNKLKKQLRFAKFAGIGLTVSLIVASGYEHFHPNKDQASIGLSTPDKSTISQEPTTTPGPLTLSSPYQRFRDNRWPLLNKQGQ